MENHKLEKQNKLFVALIILISLIPVFYIGRYNHPSADDYGYSAEMHFALQAGTGFLGVLKTAWETSLAYMKTWQGLYSSSFVLSMQPAVFGEKYYAITTPIIVAALFAGTAAFFAEILHGIFGAKRRGALFIALVIVFYMVQAMPCPVEGLYWFNGAVNYLFFWGVMMCQAALLLRYWYGEKTSVCTVIAAGILSFITSGGNHVTAFAGILFNLTACGFSLWKRRKLLVSIPAITGIAGFLLNITAPGTAVRMAKLGKPAGVISTILHSGFYALCCNIEYMSFSLLMLFVILTPVLLHLLKNHSARISFSLWGLLGLLVFDFVILSAMFAVPYYAMGLVGEGRVHNTRFVMYVLLAVLTYGYFLGCLREYWDGEGLRRRAIQTFGASGYRVGRLLIVLFATCYIALFGAGVNNHSTGAAAVGSIYGGYAQEYDREYDQRLSILEDDSIQNAVLPAFRIRPGLLFFADLEEEWYVWPNTSVAYYYEKQTVRLQQNKEE